MAPIDPYAVVIGKETRENYLTRKVNYYRAVHDCLALLPGNAKTLFWGESRSYYAPPRSVVPTVFDPHPLAAMSNDARSSADLAAQLKAGGFTHILVNSHELARLGTGRSLSPEGKQRWEGFQKEHAALLYNDTYCSIYEITH